MATIKKIGVFTSGGDAPGMNACLRAVVRTAIHYGISCYGISNGYEGMIDGQIEAMTSRSVSNIIHRGGTILHSSRSERFRTKEGRKQAFDHLQEHDIDGVIAIGGDGTFCGAQIFSDEFNIPFIGLPGTIDNDLVGTDFTIGYDTAINTAMNAIDMIRDTADAHHRLFFIEVMGRDAGFIALRSGLAAGAEDILIPEIKTDLEALSAKLSVSSHKSSMIVVVAEGDDAGGVYQTAEYMKAKHPEYDIRVTVLGHLQRGGSPTCSDRILASRMGMQAVRALREGQRNVMLGIVNSAVLFTPFKNATKHHTEIKADLMDMMEILSK
ncbi:MAG: 6-phosphofructokinase [Bacteroidetes bacterium]|nr:6-phosphofructokinase [Bacteroidota bacterium]